MKASPTKAKAGWKNVISDAKAALASNDVVKVLRLSRVNHKRLKSDAKSDKAMRRVQITEGLSLEMPSTDLDTRVKASAKDSAHRSGLSAFYRMFAIMSACTEVEFPRTKMTEFMMEWAEIWDSPLGTADGKLHGFLTFYEKYAAVLGESVWMQKFDHDSRFLQENMMGPNPDSCKRCSGTGDHDGRVDTVKPKSTTPSKATNKRDRQTPTERPAYLATQMCASMLIQGRTCPPTCSRLHSPCPSCGGACKSALACVAWNQANVTKNYGDALSRISSLNSRSKRRP